jgi:hypothetical protein
LFDGIGQLLFMDQLVDLLYLIRVQAGQANSF